MSLAIRTTQITAVYALGAWHQVQKGSFEIDAYELSEVIDSRKDKRNYYALGQIYPVKRKLEPLPRIPGSIGENWNFLSPQGCHGCQWVDPVTAELVSMSLLEIKAWKEASAD